MESNDNVEREKIESQLNDNWKTAMEQLQSDIEQYGEDFGRLVKDFPPPGSEKSGSALDNGQN